MSKLIISCFVWKNTQHSEGGFARHEFFTNTFGVVEEEGAELVREDMDGRQASNQPLQNVNWQYIDG